MLLSKRDRSSGQGDQPVNILDSGLASEVTRLLFSVYRFSQAFLICLPEVIASGTERDFELSMWFIIEELVGVKTVLFRKDLRQSVGYVVSKHTPEFMCLHLRQLMVTIFNHQ